MSFEMRTPTEAEQHVSDYCAFVDGLDHGYSWSIYEYSNDIGVREWIEENRFQRDVQKMWSRVEEADKRLRALLLPTKACFHGSLPKSHFSFWGYPPNSPELEADLSQAGVL